MAGQKLFLQEEVMLLALNEDTGRFIRGTMFAYAAAGAILAELLLAGRIGMESEGRKTYVMVRNATPIGDPVLDECLDGIARSARRQKLATLVGRFACVWELKHRVAGRLADKGILRADSEKIMLIFSRRIYPERDPEPERQVVERIRQALLGKSDPIDPRTVALIAATYPTGLLKTLFDRKQFKALKPRIEAIVQGNAIWRATKEAVEAAEAAATAAAVAAASS